MILLIRLCSNNNYVNVCLSFHIFPLITLQMLLKSIVIWQLQLNVALLWSKALLLHSRHMKSTSRVRNSACSVLHGSGRYTTLIGWSRHRGGPWNRPTVPITSMYVLLLVLIPTFLHPVHV